MVIVIGILRTAFFSNILILFVYVIVSIPFVKTIDV